MRLEYTKLAEQTGLTVFYDEDASGNTRVSLEDAAGAVEVSFTPLRIDEAHILYMETCEILASRAERGERGEAIKTLLQTLFVKYER